MQANERNRPSRVRDDSAGADVSLLLERDTELELLRSRVQGLCDDGLGGVILIEGPPGIGKTALLQATLAQRNDRVSVLRASGSELEGDLAFGAVRQLFGPSVMSFDDATRDEVFGGPAALARPVLGLAPSVSGSLGDPLYGLYWLTVALSERIPLLLSVDDAHWLDEESARFLDYLAERLDGVRALLLVGSWPDTPTGAPGRLDRLRSHAITLNPAPLSDAGIDAILQQPLEQARAVTGGNPLLVRELARALANAPDTPIEQVGPTAVARRVLDRVRRVSEDALKLAQAVSLFADGADLSVAARVAQLSTDVAVTAADDLVALEVFADDDRLCFQHPLMRRAVYDDLRPFARRSGHARAAEELAAIGAPAPMIAAHLLAGTPRRDEGDMRILVAAADDAENRQALAAAARYLERALAEGVGTTAERTNLRGQLGAILAATGRPEAVAVLGEAVEEAPELGTRADLAIRLGLVAAGHGVGARDAIALLRRLRADPDLDADRRLAMDALLAGILESVDDPDATAALDELPDDLPGDTPAERMVLSTVAYRDYLRGVSASRVRDLVLRSAPDPAAIDVGTDADDSTPLLVVCGSLEQAEDFATRRLERARASGAQAAYAAARMVLANVAASRGDLVGAEAELRLCVEPSTPARTVAFVSGYLHDILLELGRIDEAESLHGVIAGRVPVPRDQLDGLIAFARGNYRRTVEALGRARDLYLSRGVVSPVRMTWTGKLVDALVACGEVDEAREVIDEYRAGAERWGTVASIGAAHVMAGRHTPGPQGREHLEAAHALLDPSPHRLDAARARLELATRLRHDNERVAARELMLPALEYAERQRVAPLVTRLREELAMCGSRPRKVVLRGIEALTPAEARIARLAADGLQNKEIAQQLFLTVGTVQTTLVRVYRKLDVGSRRDLATAVGG